MCGSVGFPTRYPSRILLFGLAPVPPFSRYLIFFFFYAMPALLDRDRKGVGILRY